MAKRKRKTKPTQLHPLLTMKRGIVWVQKWNAHRRREARRLDLESRKASKESRDVRREKTAERDKARKAREDRIRAGAQQEAQRTAPQTVRVRQASPAKKAAAARPATTKAAVSGQQPMSFAERQRRVVAAGMCGAKTLDGSPCLNTVTESPVCAAGHIPVARQQHVTSR
jgi:hypothetical protein